MKFFNEDNTKQTALVGTGVAGLGLAARSIQKVHDPRILVSYGYVPGKGGSHKTLANAFQYMLEQNGYKNVDVVNSAKPKDILKYVNNAERYSVHVPAGWGIKPVIGAAKAEGNWSTDFEEGKFIPVKDFKEYPHNPEILYSKFPHLQGKKIITISAGESGSQLDTRVPHILEAVKGRDDIHVIAIAANSKDDVKNKLRSIPNVTTLDYTPNKEFNEIASSSHLNINFGNPQGLIEQIGYKNENISLFREGAPNNPMDMLNATAGDRRYGVPSVRMDDPNLSNILNDMLDNPGTNAHSARRAEGLENFKKDLDNFKTEFRGSIQKVVKKGTNPLRYAKALGFGALGAGALYSAYKRSKED